jgi:hypothetical protein
MCSRLYQYRLFCKIISLLLVEHDCAGLIYAAHTENHVALFKAHGSSVVVNTAALE